MEPAATRVRARKRRLSGPRTNVAWLHRSGQLTPRPALVAVAG
ncbi:MULTISPECIES: hypothetical protein [unclassified Streptomyces]|uniref:Uncharacterized protein n=1 Tax=Streptomyces sp. NBC_00060 TaxID=2975636 RepID=A0AAU2GT57_9ACTN